jgi:hypothetical protein
VENTSNQKDNFPKIVEISKEKKTFKVNRNDPAFDRPLSRLAKVLAPENQTGILIFKIK